MKKKRQAEILRLISLYDVETQEMLQSLLKQSGYNVTQATVSRDINELNIEKCLGENGVVCYAKASRIHTVRFHNIISEAVVSIDYAMNIVSVKCHSGLANAACAGLDAMNLSYVVGTIAGDGTTFVVTRPSMTRLCFADSLKKCCREVLRFAKGAIN